MSELHITHNAKLIEAQGVDKKKINLSTPTAITWTVLKIIFLYSLDTCPFKSSCLKLD